MPPRRAGRLPARPTHLRLSTLAAMRNGLERRAAQAVTDRAERVPTVADRTQPPAGRVEQTQVAAGLAEPRRVRPARTAVGRVGRIPTLMFRRAQIREPQPMPAIAVRRRAATREPWQIPARVLPPRAGISPPEARQLP